MQNSSNPKNRMILKNAPHLLMQVFKSLGVPRDLAVWIGAIELKTDEQAADMAIWLYRNKETDSQKLLAKAQEIAACNGVS
jgi:hypothetical protein